MKTHKLQSDTLFDFANRLRLEREKLGFSSQAKIAEICGVNKDVWGRYERGTSIPNAETLLIFMELGADINYLFTGITHEKMSNQPYPSDSDMELDLAEKYLIESYRNINSRHKLFLDRVIIPAIYFFLLPYLKKGDTDGNQ